MGAFMIQKKTNGLSPLVSVIMPVFNREQYVGAAIQSILDQSYSNFELIIVNDGSTDKSEEIINDFKKKDSRIISISQTNQGIVSARNAGCSNARGDYIAILDSDDISVRNRLERQILFLESNPDVGICGSWVKTIEDDPQIWRYPTLNDDIKASLLFFCPFAHSSIMMRRSAIPFFPSPYTESFDTAEDYDLWEKCMDITAYSNLSEILVFYRVHDANISIVMNTKNRDLARKIRKRIVLRLDPNISEEEIQIHTILCEGLYGQICQLEDGYAWLKKIINLNQSKNLFSTYYLLKRVNKLLISFYCSKFLKSNPQRILKQVITLPLINTGELSFFSIFFFRYKLFICPVNKLFKLIRIRLCRIPQ